jgi:hypothetical protein
VLINGEGNYAMLRGSIIDHLKSGDEGPNMWCMMEWRGDAPG